jgi:hypothetical protein
MTKDQLINALNAHRHLVVGEFRGYEVRANAAHYSILTAQALFDVSVWGAKGSTPNPTCPFKSGDIVVALDASDWSRSGKYGAQGFAKGFELLERSKS